MVFGSLGRNETEPIVMVLVGWGYCAVVTIVVGFPCRFGGLGGWLVGWLVALCAAEESTFLFFFEIESSSIQTVYNKCAPYEMLNLFHTIIRVSLFSISLSCDLWRHLLSSERFLNGMELPSLSSHSFVRLRWHSDELDGGEVVGMYYLIG